MEFFRENVAVLFKACEENKMPLGDCNGTVCKSISMIYRDAKDMEVFNVGRRMSR
jgi:hypothetical protein